MTFGERLKELRKQQKISQRDLAEAVGLDYTYISKIETGNTPPPSAASIHRLALVLAADESELIVLAGKVPIEAYRSLLRRAYTLLENINHFEIDRSSLIRWVEDAKMIMKSDCEATS